MDHVCAHGESLSFDCAECVHAAKAWRAAHTKPADTIPRATLVSALREAAREMREGRDEYGHEGGPHIFPAWGPADIDALADKLERGEWPKTNE